MSTDWARNQPRVPYDREGVLGLAEAGARDTHGRLRHRGEDWVVLDGREIGLRLEDRVRRAREYAVWRIASYERGETVTPW